MNNKPLSSQLTDNETDDHRPAYTLGVRMDESTPCTQRRAVRYDSGVRYADCTQEASAHGVTSLLLSLIGFLLMVMAPLFKWLIVPCVCLIGVSLYFCYKALRHNRSTGWPAHRVMAYGGMVISLTQISIMVVVAFAVALLDFTLPY